MKARENYDNHPWREYTDCCISIADRRQNTVRFDVNLSPGKYTINCDRNDQAMNAGDYNYPYPLGGIGSL